MPVSRNEFNDLLEKLNDLSMLIDNTSFIKLDDAKSILDQTIKRHYKILMNEVSEVVNLANKTGNCEPCNAELIETVSTIADVLFNPKK